MARVYKVIDDCPVPAGLYDELVVIKADAGLTYNSIYRGEDAEVLLKELGKKSQTQLYYGYIHGWPGYNPANPPKQSTHECYSDGVAYPVPRGVRLPYWCCGIDSTWSEGATQAAAKRGWTCTLTYPNNPREGHHVNFRKEPKLRVRRPLKRGSRGPRVAVLSRRLRYLGFYRGGISGHYGRALEQAVKDFQKHYHQKPDGIVGIQTARQLGVAVRGRKKCRRRAIAETKGHPKEREARLRKCNRRFGPERDE